MQYERLLLLVCVAALSSGMTLTALASVPAQALLRRHTAPHAPRKRARVLFAWRLAPVIVGFVTSIGVAFAFIRHEPRHTTEEAGAVLLALVGWTLVLTLVGASRLIAGAWQTARCHRLVRRHGRPIEMTGFPLPVWRVSATFPVAAISGVLRPRLILSARVLDECSPDELLTVLRHERAHVRHRDNLVRAFFLGLPDAVALLRGGDTIAEQWHEAVEEAADDEAVGASSAARLALASALVRVGRMATQAPPDWMPALALFDGDNLEHRVRRLVNPEALPPRRRELQRVCGVVLGLSMAGVAAWMTTGPRLLHELMEWAVRNLP